MERGDSLVAASADPFTLNELPTSGQTPSHLAKLGPPRKLRIAAAGTAGSLPGVGILVGTKGAVGTDAPRLRLVDLQDAGPDRLFHLLRAAVAPHEHQRGHDGDAQVEPQRGVADVPLVEPLVLDRPTTCAVLRQPCLTWSKRAAYFVLNQALVHAKAMRNGAFR
jgi:hypothetical protein